MLCPGFSRTMTSSHHEDGILQPAFLPSNRWLRGEREHHVRRPADVDAEESRRSHTDDGERDALHGQLASHDIFGAAEVLTPEAMTDDDDGTIRCSAAIVCRHEQTTAHRTHAEFVEEPPAYVCAVDGHGSAALREVEALARPRKGAVEQLVLAGPDLLPHGIRPGAVGEQREAGRIADGQRAQDQAVEDREQRRVGADAERERADDREREARALAQATHESRMSCRTLSIARIAHTSRASSTASVTLPIARRLAWTASVGSRPSRSSAS